jgi:hypothetical protein
MEPAEPGRHVVLRYRNRTLTEADLAFLREQCARDWSTRTDLARSLCAAWNWRQANGSLAEHACFDLLLRLQERGLLQLPPAACAGPRRGRRSYWDLPVPPELVALVGLEVRDPDADLATLSVRPITADERMGWRLYVGRYHYLGDRPIVGEQVLYAAFLDGEVVGLLGWASAALHAPLREAFIGWDELTKRRRLHFVVNNVRFLILPWVRVRNLASKVLALNLRRLSEDWERVWRHPVYLAETFVDAARFRGTCYRAANWVHLGYTAGRAKRGNEYLFGASPKALFVYPLGRHARRRLCGDETP